MERRAEINRFAIFLFCLLVPLGSSAPTEISESKMTEGQRQKRFTTGISPSAAVIEKRAHELFEFYHNCVLETLHSGHKTFRTKARKMVERIPECPAFQANCCALHHIHNILTALSSDIETICNQTSRDVVTPNLKQLSTTLSERAALYTCRTEDLPQLYPQGLGLADRKTYIWWFLKKYEKIMQITNNPKQFDTSG